MVPVPYMLRNDHRIIIVAGNFSRGEANLAIKLPMEKAGIDPGKIYTVTDLWNNRKISVKGSSLTEMKLKVRPDKIHGGGLSAIRIDL